MPVKACQCPEVCASGWFHRETRGSDAPHCCVQKLADPDLALQKRVRKVQRRVEGQKRQREELKKQRSSGLAVKNRRDKRMKS